MRRFGLIGFPLSHSFSQKYFEEKFQQEGITDCRYELYPIKSIYELSDLLLAYPDLLGLNVTIPYKQQVIRQLTSTINIPLGLRACNCIRIDNKQLIGYNTDIIGFSRSFAGLLQPHHKKALILGNGGAAAAVAFCLEQLGITFSIVSRKIRDGASLTYSDLNENVIAAHQVIINTTPVGMYPVTDEAPPLPYHAITSRHYLFDLLYNPAKTLFLTKGEEKGALIRNGHEMLVIQAEESWKIWNGEVS
jgi:shikimate dehydrogenase